MSECLIATNTGHDILMTISINVKSDKIHKSLNIRCCVLILRKVSANCWFILADGAFECVVLKQSNKASGFPCAGVWPRLLPQRLVDEICEQGNKLITILVFES